MVKQSSNRGKLNHRKQLSQGDVRNGWWEFLTVAGMIVLVIGELSGGNSSEHNGTGQALERFPAPTATALAEHYGAEATALATQMANYPPEKATAQAYELQQVATAAMNAAPKTDPVAARPIEDPTWKPAVPVMGIIDTNEAPATGPLFRTRNKWQVPFESETKWLQVYAGAMKNGDGSESREGALLLYTMNLDEASWITNYLALIPAPANVGPLTITAVNGDVMELRTDDGKNLTFDLWTRRFQ